VESRSALQPRKMAVPSRSSMPQSRVPQTCRPNDPLANIMIVVVGVTAGGVFALSGPFHGAKWAAP
jgi:hypothetical protein